MKVLMIGQLPKEVGGNYSTGAAKVVYELSRIDLDDTTLFTFATNTKSDKARLICRYENEYMGYSICLFQIIISLLFHPIRMWREISHYIKIDHGNPLRYMFYKENIKKSIRYVKPDIIHVHSISNVSPVRYALEGKRIPILLTCHGIFYRGEESDKYGRDIWQGNINLADAYTGLTKESALEYENYLGIDRKRVYIIPNGVDCSKFFYSPDARMDIRNKMGVEKNSIVFITVASVQKRKGQYQFVNLLEKLDLSYQYWIIGKGEDETIIQKYIDKYGVSDKVKMMGYKHADELYKYYSAADIYAHVSEKEGQALSEIEADATGLRIIVNKPIVGTIAGDVTTSNYYILDMDNLDKDMLKQWILSGMGKSRVSNHTYSWQLIAEKYSNLYKKLL